MATLSDTGTYTVNVDMRTLRSNIRYTSLQEGRRNGYIVKLISKGTLLGEIRKMGLIK